MLYRFLALILASFFSVNLYSQPGRGGAERTANGIITGKVIDVTTRQPMEFTTVALLNWRDSSIVTGSITNSKGHFRLENLPVGRYRLSVNFIGYYTETIDSVWINARQPQIDLAAIALRPAVERLAEVEVVSETGMFQNAIDRKVFNVEKSISTAGGTALDVLEKVPSINVDMDGKVSLRGSENVRILIDGKPSGLGNTMLEQLPASSIENVEIITNPSAKFDPDGMSGIINIVTKHNKLQGFNGNVNLSYSRIDRYNASLNLNYRKGIANYYVNYSYRKDMRPFVRSNVRENFYNPVATWFLQDGQSVRLSDSHTLKTGIDLSLSKNNSLGFSVLFSSSYRNDDELIEFQRRDINYTLNQLYTRSTVSESGNSNVDITLNYMKRFSQKDRMLSADVSFSGSAGDDDQLYEQVFLNPDYSTAGLPSLQEWTTSASKNRYITMQADYSHPLTEKIKLETGVKVNIREVGDDFRAAALNNVNLLWYNDTNRTNHFVYNDEIYAAYAILSGKYKKLGWQTGLRAEQAYTHPYLKTTGKRYHNDYRSLFPSAFLSYELKNNQLVMLNYTRRINRPSMFSLNPFPNYSDPLNVRQGNPYINPEYISAFELSHGKYEKKYSFTTTVYYRYTTDVISRFRQSLTDSSLVITEANLNRSESYGFEFITMVQLLKWWNINYSLNLYEQRIDGSNVDARATNQGFSWNTKLNSSMNLPWETELQLSGMYFAPQVTAQGEMKARAWADFGVKKNLWNKRGSIGVRISDVFNSRQFQMSFVEPTYRQNFLRKRDSVNFFITFTYRFGTTQRQMEQQRRRQNGTEPQPEMEMMF